MNKINLPFMFVSLITCLLPALANADYLLIEEDHPSVTYTGAWNAITDERPSGGRLVAGGVGSTASVTFNGTGITWIDFFDKRARGGSNIYLDGVLVATTPTLFGVIDMYGEKQNKWSIAGLADTAHVLTIEGTDAEYGFNQVITLDAFYVERGGETRVIEESDQAISYTGTWTEFDDPSVSGGSVLASNEPGATATVRYNGDAISWISYLCPCAAGLARVSMPNNNVVETRHAYATERQPQAIIYNYSRAGIQERELTIEVTGDSAAQSPWVVIDAFRVQTGSSGDADITPPQIAIRAPQNGDTVTGRVYVYSDVFDNEIATSVQYYVDDIPVYVETTQAVTMLTYRYWWTTTGYDDGFGNVSPAFSDGPHVLTAVARDAAGNETRSAPVNIIVDNSQPTVTLTAPASGAQVTGVVTLSADVTGGSFGTSNGVQFHARASDGTYHYLGVDTTAPYAITRDTSNVPSGRTFELTASVYNLSGSQVLSPPSSVTVQH